MAELDEAADKAGAAVRLAEAAAGDVVEVVHNHIAWMWAGGAVGAGAGLGVGYFIAQVRLKKKYEQIAEDEISQMRQHFRQRMVARDSETKKVNIDELREELKEKTEELGYKEPSPPGAPNVQAPAESRNVFHDAKPTEEWNYELEKARRVEGGTYVIHKDEYGELDTHQEMTLSYYAGDDVLCDAQDRVVDNQYVLVADCLDRFGHGSDDRNVVYIRNEVLSLDMEVIKSEKTYAEEVHGFRHQESPKWRHPNRRT